MSSCAKWYISISVRGRIFSHITASIDDIETQQQQHRKKKVYKRFWPSTNVSLLLSFTLSYALSEWTLENLFGCVCDAQAFEWTATGCSCAALTAGDKGEQNSVSLCVRCALIWQILNRTVLTANSTRVASHPRFHLRRVWERKRDWLPKTAASSGIFTTHKFPLNSSFFTSGSPPRNTFLFSCYSDSVCYWRQTICLIAAWQATNDVISTKLYIFINRTSMLHTRYFISGVCALLRCDNKWISSVPSIYRHRKRIYWNCEGTIKTEKKARRRSEVSDNYELVRVVRAACV